MADANDSGNADIHSPPRRDWAGVEEWRFTPTHREALAMVPGVALVAGTFYRHRPTAGAHSFTESLLIDNGQSPDFSSSSSPAGLLGSCRDREFHFRRQLVVHVNLDVIFSNWPAVDGLGK